MKNHKRNTLDFLQAGLVLAQHELKEIENKIELIEKQKNKKVPTSYKPAQLDNFIRLHKETLVEQEEKVRRIEKSIQKHQNLAPA